MIKIKDLNKKFGNNEVLKNIPKDYFFYLLPLLLFSTYSLIVGNYNSISSSHEILMLTLYSRLPEGIFNLITMKLAFPILIITLLINILIIKYRAPLKRRPEND